MSISFSRAYVANGKVYASLKEAQIAELDALFAESPTDPASLTILKNPERVIDILTTTESSKPKARAINGGTKKRRTKAAPQLPLPGTEAAA